MKLQTGLNNTNVNFKGRVTFMNPEAAENALLKPLVKHLAKRSGDIVCCYLGVFKDSFNFRQAFETTRISGGTISSYKLTKNTIRKLIAQDVGGETAKWGERVIKSLREQFEAPIIEKEAVAPQGKSFFKKLISFFK